MLERLLVLMLVGAAAFQKDKLMSCLNLIKWKIDHSESMFDGILAGSDLDQEKLVDKLIGNMMEACVRKINQEETKLMEVYSGQNFTGYNYLLNFSQTNFSTEADLELSAIQEQILEELERHTEEIKTTDPHHMYLLVSFAIVLLIIALKQSYAFIKDKKWFKLD